MTMRYAHVGDCEMAAAAELVGQAIYALIGDREILLGARTDRTSGPVTAGRRSCLGSDIRLPKS